MFFFFYKTDSPKMEIDKKKTLPDGDVFFRVPSGIRMQMLEIWRYRMNNSSRYFGRGQRLSSTMSSSLSIW